MRRRILAATILVAAVAVLLLGVPLVYVLDRLATREAEERLLLQAEPLAVLADEAAATGEPPPADELASLLPAGHALTVIEADGEQTTIGEAGVGDRITVRVDTRAGLVVELSAPARSMQARVQRSAAVLAGLALLAFVGAATVGAVASRRLTRPLDTLARSAHRLAAGDFSVRADRFDIPEVDAIADGLDAAAIRVGGLVRAERSFSTNASHQLRSGLTGLALRLEELAGHPDESVRVEAVAAQASVDRLTATVDELLALARTGRAGVAVEFDLGALVGAHVEDWRARFASAGRTVVAHTAPVTALATPGAVGQILDVLLSNALVHGQGTATVTVTAAGHHARCTVADEGQGATDARFEASGRPDHGIGLDLARTLAEGEGGRLVPEPGAPTRFTLTVPRSTGA